MLYFQTKRFIAQSKSPYFTSVKIVEIVIISLRFLNHISSTVKKKVKNMVNLMLGSIIES